MNLFKKLFTKNPEEELRNVLDTIEKANKIIANMGNSQNSPSKDIFIKALSEIEDAKENPVISDDKETRKSLENFQKTCVQMIAAILHAEGLVPFQAGDYQKTFEILDGLRELIVKYCEFFEIERSKLRIFIEDIRKDFSGSPNEKIKSLNSMRTKYQEKAREVFGNAPADTFVEMLVDAIVVTIACKAMIKK